MKKFLRLLCNTCKRDIDKIVDLTHYAPDKCIITQGCEGRLYPLEYRSSAGIATAPEVGITDWRPRRSTISQEIRLADVELIDLSTGTKNQLVLAARLSAPPINTDTIVLPLKIKTDTPKTYRQYVFRKEGSFSVVSGVESGLEKKTLRFKTFGTSPDMVEVYVNGVKREQGLEPEDYQLDDGSGSSPIPANTISFNKSIVLSGITQVDVIVSKEQMSTTSSITFKRNKLDESRIKTGAWENVGSVKRFIAGAFADFYLFTCDLDTAGLTLNTVLTYSGGQIVLSNTQVILAEDVLFLIARKPYSILDRYTTLAIPITSMSEKRDYIKYYTADGIRTARAASTLIETIYPPLQVEKFSIENTIKTSLSGVAEQIVIDGKVITGPDA